MIHVKGAAAGREYGTAVTTNPYLVFLLYLVAILGFELYATVLGKLPVTKNS